ncbi:MAG: TrmH family RNA methyltransferase [Actinomycetota bacterium]
MPEVITSTANPLVRRARKLRHRKYRESEGVFLIEGIAHVRQALDHGADIEQILVAPDLLDSQGAWEVVEARERAGMQVVRLGREAFESITERDHPSGLAATVRSSDRPLTDLVAGPGDFFVALHDVGNPGNLGSVIRTVDAVGGHGVVIVGDSTDHRHPAAVKASMGTIFTVPTFQTRSLDDLFAWCLMEDVPVMTTSVRGESLLWDTDLSERILFLFGSEAMGLPPEVLARGDTSISLPMKGAASSLNLAVAVGVILYEVARQRRDP